MKTNTLYDTYNLMKKTFEWEGEPTDHQLMVARVVIEAHEGYIRQLSVEADIRTRKFNESMSSCHPVAEPEA